MNENYNDSAYGEPDYYELYTKGQIKEARSTFSRCHLALVLYIVSAYVAILITEIVMLVTLGKDTALSLIENNIFVVSLLSFAPSYLVGLPIFLLLTRGMKTAKREKRKITFYEFFSLFLISQVGLVVGSTVSEALSSFISMFKGSPVTNHTDTLITSMPIWLVLLVTVIIAPIVEELMFRKVIMDRFSRYGDAVAITVSSISFGLFHGNFYQFFYAAILGFILGFIYAKTRNIVYPILMHALINLVGTLPSLLISDRLIEFEKMFSDFANGLSIDMTRFIQNMMIVGSYSVISYTLVIAGIVMLVSFFKKKKYRIRETFEYKLPKERTASVVVLNVGTILFLVLSAATFVMETLS